MIRECDQPMVVQIGRRLRHAVPADIVRRSVDVIVNRHQGAADQIGLGRFDQADRNIRFAHSQVEIAVGQKQADVDIRILLQKFAHARRQPARAQSGRGGDDQRPLRFLLALGNQGLGLVQPARHLADVAVQQFALLGEDQAAGVPVEQRRVERLLERADLPADGRLAQMQNLASMGEAAGIGNRQKNP